MNIVTVHNLKKYFGKGENQVKALDGIDLEIEKGKFTAIIGASGSGKTTLLNMIGGMDIPDEGEVIVDGVNLRGLKEKELAVFRRSRRALRRRPAAGGHCPRSDRQARHPPG